MKHSFNLDLNALCRLCLNKGPELRPIFDCDVNFSYLIESCVGLEVSKYLINCALQFLLISLLKSQLHQYDPGPSQMCIDCLTHLENWEGFKEKCISANESIQEYLKQLEEETLIETVDKIEKFDSQLEADEHNDNYDSTINNGSNNQDSDNDSLKSKSPISITVM